MIQIGSAFIGDSGGGVLDLGGQGTGDALIVLGSGVQMKDPIFLIGRDNNFQQYDLGFIGQRFQNPTAINYNVGVIWDESAEEFAIAKIAETGTTNGNTTLEGYAPVRMGNTFIQGAVGINTSNPTQTLDVIGGVDADDYFVNGVSIVRNTGAAVTILNAGAGTGLYYKVGATNYIKSIFPGNGVTISESGSGIAISSSSNSLNFYNTGSQVEIFINSGDDKYIKTLYADAGITLTESGGAIRVKNVAQDRSTYNGGGGSGIYYASGDSNYFKSLIAGNYINIADYGSSDSLELSVTGLGTAATKNSGDFLQVVNNLSDLSSASASRTNLGLGTISTFNSGDFAQTSNNLSDLASASSARTNLGLGTAATKNSGDFLQVSNNLSDLGSASTARTNLGLGTSSLYNIASSGNAATGEVVFGNDSRLSDARTPSAHTHTLSEVTDAGTAASKNSGDFLQVTNDLSDISSTSSARTNLGLGTVATLNSGVFTQTANNLSDLASASIARTNLGLGTAATKNSGDFLQVVNDLSDISSAGNARINLGLGTISTFNSGSFAQTSNNLSDLSDATTSRANLGLGTISTLNSGVFVQAANNLSDLASASGARSNLGLGTASLLNTGTASGQMLVLEAGGKLPVVDGSQLTNLNSAITISNRGTDNPHLGSNPHQPFQGIDNKDNSAFIRSEKGRITIVNARGTIGITAETDNSEPDIEYWINNSKYSAASLDTDILDINGLPSRQNFNPPDLGSRQQPLIIIGQEY